MDLDELMSSGTEEALKEAKLWLFKENIRLQNELKELEENRNRFIKERAQFRDEMNSFNRKMVMEKKRLKDDNLFFEKKMQILQDGFRQLEMDRRKFEKDKLMHESSYRNEERQSYRSYSSSSDSEVADILFSGVNNSLGLKKRYRDLIKIFHPDNLCGDARIVQIINQEYERKRAE